MGSDEYEQSKCEEILCELMDLRNQMIEFAYQTDASLPEAQRCCDQAKVHFEKLEKHLEHVCADLLKDRTATGKGGGVCHLVGGTFSAPDFHLYELLDQYKGLSAYMASFCHMELPYNSCMAAFGSDCKTNGKFTRGQEAAWRKKGAITEKHP